MQDFLNVRNREGDLIPVKVMENFSYYGQRFFVHRAITDDQVYIASEYRTGFKVFSVKYDLPGESRRVIELEMSKNFVLSAMAKINNVITDKMLQEFIDRALLEYGPANE